MASLVIDLLERYGLVAVAALLLLENLVPVIPSELILPFVGFEAASGRMPPLAALLAATVASALGGLAWYAIGRRMGMARLTAWVERRGAWTTLSRKELERGQAWFARWGGAAVMVGRALPGVRSFIPVPAGVAGQPIADFLAWSSAGALIWSALLMAMGYLLQADYASARHWIDPVLDVLAAGAVVLYVVRFLRCRRRGQASATRPRAKSR